MICIREGRAAWRWLSRTAKNRQKKEMHTMLKKLAAALLAFALLVSCAVCQAESPVETSGI